MIAEPYSRSSAEAGGSSIMGFLVGSYLTFLFATKKNSNIKRFTEEVCDQDPFKSCL